MEKYLQVWDQLKIEVASHTMVVRMFKFGAKAAE